MGNKQKNCVLLSVSLEMASLSTMGCAVDGRSPASVGDFSKCRLVSKDFAFI